MAIPEVCSQKPFVPPVCTPNPTPEYCRNTAHFGAPEKIAQLNGMIGHFISECDRVLHELRSARWTEVVDMGTSNTSLFGYAISNISYEENHAVARHLDALEREAAEINRMVFSCPQRLQFLRLDTDLGGNEIRRAENAEHSFFLDLFTDSYYSSFGSANTLRKIQSAIGKVTCVQRQAESLRSSLSFLLR